jgi:hypothetical protein
MKNTSMDKWINSKKNVYNENYVFYVKESQIDEAVKMAFDENIQLPQIQEILKVLSTQ